MNERVTALLIVIGALLFGIATVFHPPLSNPWDVAFAYRKITEDGNWKLDHCVFLFGLALWLVSLSTLPDISHRFSEMARNGARILISSLGMWLLILSIELSVLPQMISSIEVNGNAAYQPIWNALFTWTLFSGYLTTGFIDLGLFIISASFDQNLVKKSGMIAASIGAIGIAVSLLFPKYALWMQVFTEPLPYLWTYGLAGNLLIKKSS